MTTFLRIFRKLSEDVGAFKITLSGKFVKDFLEKVSGR
jgi:hypothetical protein